MAKILILGGGFGGVVAAEHLAKRLGNEHQIMLVSRSRNFVFYPALVRLAFGKCEKNDLSFDLRHAMLDRRVNFIEAEIAHIDPLEEKVTIAHGEIERKLPYDYLIFALGRRLVSERITGFFEHAHHLLNVDKAIQFGKAIANFHEGHAVIAQCDGARLPVPIYETAFALARRFAERGERERVRITVVNPLGVDSTIGGQADAEIEGREPVAHYSHEMRLIIEEPGGGSIYLHKDVWADEPGIVREGRFWSWAKRVQQRYWGLSHSWIV